MRVPLWLRRTAVAAGVGIGTAGVLAGVIMLGPLTASVLLAVVFVLIWPLAATIKHLSDQATFGSPLLVAAAAAGGVLAVPGLIRLLSWGAIGVVIALVAAMVFVLVDLALPDTRHERRPRRGWKRSRRRGRVPEYRDLLQLTHEEQIEDEKLIASLRCPLSIEELCGVWGETTTTLAQGAGPRDRQAVAEVRRICLDEFERRNPTGFQRWLAAGPTTDPTPYLLPTPTD